MAPPDLVLALGWLYMATAESSVKIVLTATGFIFQPEIQEPGDASVVGAGKCTAAGGLLLVSGGERPQRLPALAF